jgi:predicted enzyme related to lactoylglutathione lyase
MQVLAGFGSFAVKDLSSAMTFYTDSLGLQVEQDQMGLKINPPSGGQLFVYEKPDHEPAGFTVLNVIVPDIDAAVEELLSKGITMARYDSMPASQDEKGILRGKAAGMGPDIAWIKDPSGNVVSIIEDDKTV